MVISILKDFVNKFLIEKDGEFTDSESGKIIRHDIPDEIKKIVGNNYKCKGSVGNGQFVEIPWISIIKEGYNFSPQKGFYLVFLFSSDLKKMYLSLNQGFNYLKDRYGLKYGKEVGEITAKFLRRSNYFITDRFKGKIDLNANNSLGKGYEVGNIVSIKYNLNQISNDKRVIRDIKIMLNVYDEVLQSIGNREIDNFYDYIVAYNKGLVFDESKVNDGVYRIIDKDYKESKDTPIYNRTPKIKKNTIIDYDGNSKYPRDNRVAANALRIADFLCEYRMEHKFFSSRNTNNNYTESHHLIPLSQHNKFEFSLDVEENICSLCSICHDCVHYGKEEERNKILLKLYESRIEMLKEVGLDIGFEELKSFY